MAQDELTEGSAGAVETEQYEAFVVEQRGIDYVPAVDRHTRPIDLGWMWAATTSNVLVFVYGSLVVLIGLSFAQAVVVITLGTIFGYLLLGIASLIGPNAGTTALASARAPFGMNWNRFNAFSNWILVVCYEVADLALIVLAFVALAGKAGIADSTGLKIVLILVAVAIQLPLPLYGHATVIRAMRYLVWLLLALFVVMAILLAGKVHPSQLHQHGTVAAITVALALTLSGGGLGWVAYAADYSRYVPTAASKQKIVWSVTVGAMLPQIFYMLLGAAVTTTVPGASSAIAGVSQALPGWFVVPYLILAIISLYAVNTIDLYSSGLNLQAIGFRVRRTVAVCIDLTLCTIALFFVIFSSRFNTLLTDFLLFGLVWISPFVGIYLMDWLLRGGWYDPLSLLRRRGGIYWHNEGFRIPAVVAQVIGMVCSFLWLQAYPVWSGPLSSATGDSDWDILFGGGVAALIYALVAGRSVVAEGRETRAKHAGLEREAASAVSRITI